jgi:hypothetical protein
MRSFGMIASPPAAVHPRRVALAKTHRPNEALATLVDEAPAPDMKRMRVAD